MQMMALAENHAFFERLPKRNFLKWKEYVGGRVKVKVQTSIDLTGRVWVFISNVIHFFFLMYTYPQGTLICTPSKVYNSSKLYLCFAENAM